MATENETPRAEHLAWAKRRALEYLPADPSGAVLSMLSDLRKHRELADHCGIQLGVQLYFGGLLSSVQDVRHWIEGFN